MKAIKNKVVVCLLVGLLSSPALAGRNKYRNSHYCQLQCPVKRSGPEIKRDVRSAQKLKTLQTVTINEPKKSLFDAIEQNDCPEVTKLVDNNVSLLTTDQEENNVLHYGVQNGRSGMLEMLFKYLQLQAALDRVINAPNRHGVTAYDKAINENKPALAILLLAHGANPRVDQVQT